MEILKATVYDILADLGHKSDILGRLREEGDHRYDTTLREIERARSRLVMYGESLGRDGQLDVNTAMRLVLGTYDLDERVKVGSGMPIGDIASYLKDLKEGNRISVVGAHKKLFDPTKPEEWDKSGVSEGSNVHIFTNCMGTADVGQVESRLHEIGGMFGELLPHHVLPSGEFLEYDLDTRGAHARTCTEIVEKALVWPHDVCLAFGNEEHDAKSIFSLMVITPQLAQRGDIKIRFYKRERGSDDPFVDIGYNGVRQIFVDHLNTVLKKDAEYVAEQRRMAEEDRERKSSE